MVLIREATADRSYGTTGFKTGSDRPPGPNKGSDHPPVLIREATAHYDLGRNLNEVEPVLINV